jgi:DNA-binding response OmpR family regulator
MARLLLVEDDAAVRKTLCKILERSGHTVMEAGDADETMRIVAEHEIDIALIDIILPGKDGFDLILEIRKRRPSTKIIAMSGGSEVVGPTKYLKITEQLGVQGVLAKPFELEQLLALIERCIAEPKPKRKQ